MRRWGGLMAALIAGSAFAQDTFPGTKPDIVAGAAPSSGGSGLMPLFQMAIAAALILMFLKVWLPKLLGRINRRMDAKPGVGIRIEEAATFAAGTLYLVEVRGHALLLCAAANGVTCLADLTEAGRTRQEKPAFFEILDEKASRRPSSPTPEMSEVPGSCDFRVDDAAAALERARRLVV